MMHSKHSRCMELTPEQQKCLDLIKEGRNVFLTGQAGTGKSITIGKATEWLQSTGMTVAKTSLTGISALVIGGRTLHSWSGIRKGEERGEKLLELVRKNRGAARNWKQTSVLFIDEISMLTPDLFDELEWLGRVMRHSHDPFGGIQIIACGDLCQLPPVATDVLCIKAKSWDKVFASTIYLRQNMRQDDPVFQAMLARIRMGVVTAEDKLLLESRVDADVSKEFGDQIVKPTELYSHRAAVDKVNKAELIKLLNSDNVAQRFRAIDSPKADYHIGANHIEYYTAALNKACQAKQVLDLAVGAQVMLIKNLDTDAGLVNGSRGVIIKFQEQRPVVQFINGLEVLIQPVEWDFRVNEKVRMVRRQIPLILAWASTIHKAQGQTLDCVKIDLGKSIFADGQFYTALSRVRALSGLSISDLDFNGVKVNPVAEEFYRHLEMAYGE